MTILLLKNIYGDMVRVFAEKITSYHANGEFTNIELDGRSDTLTVQNSVESVDAALVESYCMIKRVE